MKTLKLCLLASILVFVQSVQITAQVKVQATLKHDPVSEASSANLLKSSNRTITWYSQNEEEVKVLNLDSPDLNKEFNQMVDEMDRMYHTPKVDDNKTALELGSTEGAVLKPFFAKGEF